MLFGDILSGRSDESYPYQPSSPYAASKAASDHLVSSYVRTYKIPGIVTNCSNNYGPKQHPEKLIPKLIYNILNNRPLPIYEKGKIGNFYNIGSNKNLTNLKVCEYLII